MLTQAFTLVALVAILREQTGESVSRDIFIYILMVQTMINSKRYTTTMRVTDCERLQEIRASHNTIHGVEEKLAIDRKINIIVTSPQRVQGYGKPMNRHNGIALSLERL